MALELRTEPEGKAATGSPVIVTHCDGSVRDRTIIVHETVCCKDTVK